MSLIAQTQRGSFWLQSEKMSRIVVIDNVYGSLLLEWMPPNMNYDLQKYLVDSVESHRIKWAGMSMDVLNLVFDMGVGLPSSPWLVEANRFHKESNCMWFKFNTLEWKSKLFTEIVAFMEEKNTACKSIAVSSRTSCLKYKKKRIVLRIKSYFLHG